MSPEFDPTGRGAETNANRDHPLDNRRLKLIRLASSPLPQSVVEDGGFWLIAVQKSKGYVRLGRDARLVLLCLIPQYIASGPGRCRRRQRRLRGIWTAIAFLAHNDQACGGYLLCSAEVQSLHLNFSVEWLVASR